MIGDIYADYELVETVGESETCMLFRAQHIRISGRFRAVKTPATGSESLPLALKQESLKTVFLKMCETAVQVVQACSTAGPSEKTACNYLAFIDTVHFDPDADLESNRPYILSEWVAGGSVAGRLARGPIPIEETVSILSAVLEALDFLHSHNIVHGNLKPGNILLTSEGTPKLTDYGANCLEGGAPPRLCSLPYLSPEQCIRPGERGPSLTGCADLYSLTLILYEMLTGQRLDRLLTSEQMPSCLNSQVSAAFDALIVQGLQTNPQLRFSSAQQMREHLLQAARGDHDAADAPSSVTPASNSGFKTRLPMNFSHSESHSGIEVYEKEEVPQTIPEPSIIQRRPGETRKNSKDGAEMVWVPGGVLKMGSEEKEEEQPVREVTVKGFWLYRFPVTQGLYLAYMTAVNVPGSPSVRRPVMWKRGPEHTEKPVVGLSWPEAIAYTRWAGGRLPSEAEWEWAARGSEGRRYPWGDQWDARRANTRESGIQDVSNVTDYLLGASWCKAVDLLGNVYEWCSSLYRPYPYDPEDGREDMHVTGNRVLRGGSAVTPSGRVYSAFRTAPNASTTLTGFRVVIEEE